MRAVAYRLALLALVFGLAGCDAGAPDDPPAVRSLDGVWEGTQRGGDWTGSLTLTITAPGNRPLGDVRWTDGTRTYDVRATGFVPSGGPIRIVADFGSRGELVYILDLNGQTLSGSWDGGGVRHPGSVTLTRQ